MFSRKSLIYKVCRQRAEQSIGIAIGGDEKWANRKLKNKSVKFNRKIIRDRKGVFFSVQILSHKAAEFFC